MRGDAGRFYEPPRSTTGVMAGSSRLQHYRIVEVL